MAKFSRVFLLTVFGVCFLLSSCRLTGPYFASVRYEVIGEGITRAFISYRHGDGERRQLHDWRLPFEGRAFTIIEHREFFLASISASRTAGSGSLTVNIFYRDRLVATHTVYCTVPIGEGTRELARASFFVEHSRVYGCLPRHGKLYRIPIRKQYRTKQSGGH